MHSSLLQPSTGLTVILMIIVNNQVGPQAFWPLLHAEWNGLTPTDFVFPWFLWIMGYATAITFRNLPEYAFITNLKQRYGWNSPSTQEQAALLSSPPSQRNLEMPSVRNEPTRKFFWAIPMCQSRYEKLHMWIKIFRRTFLLFLIGFVMNCITAKFDFTRVRILGVMQRISLVYFFTTLIVVLVPTTGLQVLLVLFLHGIYFVFMKFFPVPEMPGVDYCGANNVTPQCSAESFFDTKILTMNHTYRKAAFDPEGLLSTLSSVSTAFFGVIYYRLSAYVQNTYKLEKARHDRQIEESGGDASLVDETLLRKSMLYKMVAVWIMFGSVMVLLGHCLHTSDIFPYNKSIWSTSFVLTTAGCAGITLGLITFVSDILGFQRIWPQPALWVGSNPLVMYVLPEYIQVALYMIIIDGTRLRVHLYNIFFGSWIGHLSPEFANLAYGVCFEAIFIPFAWFLYWRKIYIKL